MTRLFWAFPFPLSAQQSTFDPDTGTCGPCRDVLQLVRHLRFLSTLTCPDVGLQQPESCFQAVLACFLLMCLPCFHVFCLPNAHCCMGLSRV